MDLPSVNPHHLRLQRVLAHIDAHLDDDLRVEVLSGIAAFSPYHFHRLFAALCDMNVHRYVQLARLKRASFRLAFRSNDSILNIALDSGYEGPEAFARAFKLRFGQTPSDFRSQPQWAPWHAVYQPLHEARRAFMKTEPMDDRITIVEVPDTRVAVLEHRGDPALIGDTIRRFIAWRKQTGLPPKISATYNILYDDPTTTPPEEFRLDLCAATEREIAPNDAGIVAKTIPGGRCAVLRHIGGEERFADAIAYLYGVWLTDSGEEPRDVPLYCQRVAFFPDVPEHEAVTDVFLPLK